MKGVEAVRNFKGKAGGIFLVVTMLAVLLMSGINVSAAQNFPYNAQYPHGYSSLADNQSEAQSMLESEWQSWKSAYVTSNGAGGFKRVQRDEGSKYDTVSEGMGYGLLLAVYFGEQPLFNDLYGYVNKYKNSRGLMSWHIDANGSITTNDGGKDCATDADEDIALALIFADKKWGSSGSVNYSQEAKGFINNMMTYCVESGTNVLKPGDTWGGSQVTNPSYFAPAWYKIFAKFSGDNRWNQVADKCYDIIDKVNNRNSNTGLVPDWCTAEGAQTPSQGYNYSYDAARYPWRTAIDYSWFGDSRAKSNCDKITSFFMNVGAANIADGYSIQGAKTGQWHNATFVSPVAAGAMTGKDLDFGKQIYKETIATKDAGSYHYYGNSLRLMVLLYTTGNFPNLYEDAVVVTTPPVTTPPLGNEIKGDINGDGAVNSTDYALLKRYLLGSVADLPVNNVLYVADLNGDGSINSTDYALLKRFLLGTISGF